MKATFLLAAISASVVFASATLAQAAPAQKKQTTQAQKSKAKPKPVQDPNYIDLTPPPTSGKEPNYISAGQYNSVFRGTSVGTDGGAFPSGFGLDPAPGVR